MKIAIFGLLHLSEGQRSAMNVSTKSFRDQLTVYVNSAAAFSNSLLPQGITFTLLTNDRALVEECVPSGNTSLRVSEIPFATSVPSGIGFYSAHFKLDAYRYLASLRDGYAALCDLDMLCINDYPLSLQNLVNSGVPLCYDISDQVIPAYGRDVIIRDLKAIHGLDSEGRWSGGEYISGTPEFFRALMLEIGGIYPNYLANWRALHHVGDEAITSAALELLRRRGMYVADAGTLGIVERYWNAKTLHPQKPVSYFEQCFLLHLPGDKRFLSDLARRGTVAPPELVRLYAKHRHSLALRSKRLIGRSLRFVRNLVPGRTVNRTT